MTKAAVIEYNNKHIYMTTYIHTYVYFLAHMHVQYLKQTYNISPDTFTFLRSCCIELFFIVPLFPAGLAQFNLLGDIRDCP